MAGQPPDNTSTKDKTSKTIFGEIVRSKEFIVTTTSVVTSVLVFYKQLQDHAIKDINIYSLIIEVLNIIALIIGLVIFSRKYEFKLPEGKYKPKPDEPGKSKDPVKILIEQEVQNDAKILSEAAIKEKIRNRVIQVSRIVYRLLNTFKGFAVCLILLYAFLFIADFNKKKDVDAGLAYKKEVEKAQKSLDSSGNAGLPTVLKLDSVNVKDSALYYIVSKLNLANDSIHTARQNNYKHQLDSIKGIDSVIERTYRTHTSLVQLMMPNSADDPAMNEIVVNEIIVAIVDNFFNVLSTAFLLMAFYILFHQAVEEDDDGEENLQSSNNYWTPLLIAIIIILLGTLIIFTGFCKQNLQSLVVWMRITGGIFNGVGMLLLVSRFISMEYLYKQSDDTARDFYLIGTTVVLPVYAVIQPLWGIFQVNIENKEILKEIILMLCLWGKIFFIMIIYYMLNNKWLHTYIYMMPVAEERMKLITKTFDVVASLKRDKRTEDKSNTQALEKDVD